MNETLRTIHSLRTIHGEFSARQISDADLTSILEASVRAANASARQSYSIVTVDDPEIIRRLCGYKANRALVFCVDFNRISDVADRLGHAFDAGGLVGFVTGLIDTAFAAQTAAIAARALEIETFFTNGLHRGNVDRVYELLGLPRRLCFPAIALLLGYAVQEPSCRKGRLSDAGVVHRGRYRRLDNKEADRLVATYDDPDQHLGLIDDWAQKGHRHYLDWFFKDWSRPVDPSHFYELLRRAGFLQET